VSIPLEDFSVGLPKSVHAALKAKAEGFDKTMQIVAREVLQEWADREHRAYTLYARYVMANGTTRANTGRDGTGRERPGGDGASRTDAE
jgi:hypothetical protein